MKIQFPDSPGVYIFKKKDGEVLYVGKAVNIRKRINDHFNLKNSSYKEKKLIENTENVESIQVDSEIEALLLEVNLIKKFKPDFNTQLKDDKDYIYIKITKDEFPKVLVARRRDLADASYYYGPFPSSTKVRITLKILRKIFPYSTCKPNQKRPCLAYNIGFCPGICAGKINKKEYQDNIKSLRLFLQGKTPQILNQMERKIKSLSKNLEFEEAAQIQKRLEAIHYIIRPTRAIFEYLDNDLEVIRSKELVELAQILDIKKPIIRIECYDISNIFGRQAVGSMVVFVKGNPDKDEYRRFKIKTVSGINDTAMMIEVLERRFNNNWERPDLLVMDGGRPQLNAAVKILKKLNLEIPVISLAKRFEEIYLDDQAKPLRMKRSSDALKLIQRLRDEAHRFAITYHRNIRRREFLPIK